MRDVTLELRRGEVLGIAGESGCGKSTLAYALTRMLRPPARLTGGSITFCPAGRPAGRRDGAGRPRSSAHFRWNKVSMVFQSAMNALNPVTSVGRQFSDIFARAPRRHWTRPPRTDRRPRAARDGRHRPRAGRSFPHELSGGMRQRVVIAMALALDPEVVIMDEPTTALDVVVQREILDEIERLREELGFSVIFITHDLSLLLEISDRLAVMYAGRDRGVRARPSWSPRPPRTPTRSGLLRSFPDMRGARRELRGIPGTPPDLREVFAGCAVRRPLRLRVRAVPHRPPGERADGPSAAHRRRRRAGRLSPAQSRLCPGGPPPSSAGNRA